MKTFTQWLSKNFGKYPQNMDKRELDEHVKQYAKSLPRPEPLTSAGHKLSDMKGILLESLGNRLTDESLGTEAKKELQDFYAHIEDQFS